MSSRQDLLGQTLYDMTGLLESTDRPEERVRSVLVLLKRLVPYEQCATLEARVGFDPSVVLPEEASFDEKARLLDTMLTLFGALIDVDSGARVRAPRPRGLHLAVPLVGLDEVIGLLFVRSSTEPYSEEHVRALSVVAAKIAAYFTMVRSRAELVELAGERDEARRLADVANRAKERFLALVSRQLKTPLASVLACTKTLRESVDPAVRAEALERLERSVRAQAKLIDEILDVASIAPARETRGDAAAGGGAALTVELLPAAVLAVPDRRTVRGPSDRDLDGVRVLLVDGDAGLRESFVLVLEHYGAEVMTAASAPEALAVLEKWAPHVLLFGDLVAEGPDVYELMHAVTVHVCPLPMVSISAWRLDDDERAAAAGVRLHLPKPLAIDTLVAAVAGLAGIKPAPVDP